MKLKAAFTQAALEIFREGGLDAVSIRAIAERVGVSLMTPYRYFASKSALLDSLWEHAVEGLHEAMEAAAQGATGGRRRVSATTDAYLRYWETHPDEYRLVLTRQQAHQADPHELGEAPIYARLLALLRRNTTELAAEIGSGMEHAKLAEDVSFAMKLGYLSGALVIRRYPWGDLEVVRATLIRQVVAAMEQCLTEGPATTGGLARS